jgi:hypothetical protein
LRELRILSASLGQVPRFARDDNGGQAFPEGQPPQAAQRAPRC